MKSEDNEFPYVTILESSTPATPAAGDQRLFIDSADHHLKRVDESDEVTDLEGGTAGTWMHYSGTLKVYKPVLSDFTTWINQGTATLEDFGALSFYSTWPGGDNIVAKVMDAPATPYTVDAILFIGSSGPVESSAGICWSDGTKVVYTNIGGKGIGSSRWNTGTSWSGDYPEWIPGKPFSTSNGPFYLRLVDDGTYLTTYYSLDFGKHYVQFHRASRNDFLTPTKIGICLDRTSGDVAATLVSWRVY